MATAPARFKPGPPRSDADRNREADARRGTSRERGYTTAWDRAAKAYLAKHPLCAYCALADQVTAADLVDHVYPHKGDRNLFWDSAYWAPSCTPCHSSFKQNVERRGQAALDALAMRLGLPPRPRG